MNAISNSNRKIDVHAHYLPPGYADEMRKAGIVHPDGMPDYPKWSPQLALEATINLVSKPECCRYRRPVFTMAMMPPPDGWRVRLMKPALKRSASIPKGLASLPSCRCRM